MNVKKICIFCGKREIVPCSYNASRQNCCGESVCLEMRRMGYQEKMKVKGYWKQPEVRDRANKQRRARRRSAAYSLLAPILEACAEEVKRIIEPLLGSLGNACQSVVNKVVSSIIGAAGIAVKRGLKKSIL